MTELGLITKEGKERLLEVLESNFYVRPQVETFVRDMPLITDPLDEERARWQPRTRGGHEYKLLAVDAEQELVVGRFRYADQMGWQPGLWCIDTGAAEEAESELDLIPANPFAEDAAFLRELADGFGSDSQREIDRLRRIADYIERGEDK